ncbi:MAG: redoxin domain-containing protein [Planctomycetota bacterium]|nr:redoxin domain-containing protein [Planctomycetota bacterium]
MLDAPQAPAPDVATLADLEVFDPDGDEIRLGDLWNGQRVVLVFVPQFGSAGAREHAGLVKEKLTDIRRLGAEVYLIGNGPTEALLAYETELKPGCEVYADSELKAYAAAGMLRKAGSNWALKAMGQRVRSVLQGAQGDLWQLGGVLAIAPPGRAVFHKPCQTPAEAPDLESARLALKNSGWSHLSI